MDAAISRDIKRKGEKYEEVVKPQALRLLRMLREALLFVELYDAVGDPNKLYIDDEDTRKMVRADIPGSSYDLYHRRVKDDEILAKMMKDFIYYDAINDRNVVISLLSIRPYPTPSVSLHPMPGLDPNRKDMILQHILDMAKANVDRVLETRIFEIDKKFIKALYRKMPPLNKPLADVFEYMFIERVY